MMVRVVKADRDIGQRPRSTRLLAGEVAVLQEVAGLAHQRGQAPQRHQPLQHLRRRRRHGALPGAAGSVSTLI